MAAGIEELSDGSIRLLGTSEIIARNVQIEGENVETRGIIDVSNFGQGSLGGRVEILGDKVELYGSKIDASGDLGGGSIFIGGDYQGKGTLRNAQFTSMDETSIITADAITSGDGGRVILWSDDTTLFDGLIYARGGQESGNGGFVETSGKENLGIGLGNVNTISPKGKIGSWLLDPANITIQRNNANQGTAGLNTASTCSGGNFNLNDTTINNVAFTVILCTAGVITYNNNAVINITTSGVGITHGAASTPSNITFQTGAVTTWSIITNNGPLTFNGPVSIPTGDTLSLATSGGNVSFASTVNGAGPASISAGGGTVTFTGAVGGTTALTSLTATGATITQSSTAKATGAIHYTGSTADQSRRECHNCRRYHYHDRACYAFSFYNN